MIGLMLFDSGCSLLGGGGLGGGGLGGGGLAGGGLGGGGLGQSPVGQIPGGPSAPGTDPLAGGGSAVPPLVGGPGTDMAPPGTLGAEDYDYRPDLKTVQVQQYNAWRAGVPEANVPYVADVMSHDPQPDMQTSNVGTWVHETTHGIHANIRNSNGGQGVEAVYIENGVGAIFADPGTPKAAVSSLLPAAARSVSRAQLYLGPDDWNNATHLFDEWGAYINGGRSAVETYQKGLWREGSVDEVDGMMDFLYFCSGAAKAIQQNNASSFDPQSVSGKALKAAFAVEAERTAKWLNAGLQVAEFRGFHAAQLFAHFQSSPENRELRSFLVQWYGKGFTKRLFGFES